VYQCPDPESLGSFQKDLCHVTVVRDSIMSLFSIMGALQSASLFLGVSNASSVQPVISIERTVFYREKAAGMYSPLAYAAAQVSIHHDHLCFRKTRELICSVPSD